MKRTWSFQYQSFINSDAKYIHKTLSKESIFDFQKKKPLEKTEIQEQYNIYKVQLQLSSTTQLKYRKKLKIAVSQIVVSAKKFTGAELSDADTESCLAQRA